MIPIAFRWWREKASPPPPQRAKKVSHKLNPFFVSWKLNPINFENVCKLFWIQQKLSCFNEKRHVEFNEWNADKWYRINKGKLKSYSTNFQLIKIRAALKVFCLCFAVRRVQKEDRNLLTNVWKNWRIFEYLPNVIDLIIKIVFFSAGLQLKRVSIFDCQYIHVIWSMIFGNYHIIPCCLANTFFCLCCSIPFGAMLYSVSHSDKMTMDKTEQFFSGKNVSSLLD